MSYQSQSNKEKPLAVVVMGPCGSGKSEIGIRLAEQYYCPFLDADSLHPECNIEKMKDGIPLTDEDRTPWLQRVQKEIISVENNQVNCPKNETCFNFNRVKIVAACSALKKSYRDILRGVSEKKTTQAFDDNEVENNLKIVFALLNCSKEILEGRLEQRTEHFMKSGMLESQLRILELPKTGEEKDVIIIDGNLNFTEVIQEIVTKLGTHFQ